MLLAQNEKKKKLANKKSILGSDPNVADCLIAKAERKGRTRDEVDKLVGELAKGKTVEKIKRG